MNREQIKNILPHREPMLLIDETELIDNETAIGRYTVRGDEFFLQGHFPGNPVVPGVILCEMMAQSACLLVQADGIDGTTDSAPSPKTKKFTPYFTGLKNVKFKEKITPGDTVTFKSTKTAQKGPFYFVKSEGYKTDASGKEKLCVTGELSFAVITE